VRPWQGILIWGGGLSAVRAAERIGETGNQKGRRVVSGRLTLVAAFISLNPGAPRLGGKLNCGPQKLDGM
jgi:hypothetical protein